MKKKELIKFINESFIGIDKIVQKRDGSIILMKSFFYTMGNSAEKFQETITKQFKDFNLWHTIDFIESYEQWEQFKGGASVDKQSHFGFVFKMKDK